MCFFCADAVDMVFILLWHGPSEHFIEWKKENIIKLPVSFSASSKCVCLHCSFTIAWISIWFCCTKMPQYLRSFMLLIEWNEMMMKVIYICMNSNCWTWFWIFFIIPLLLCKIMFYLWFAFIEFAQMTFQEIDCYQSRFASISIKIENAFTLSAHTMSYTFIVLMLSYPQSFQTCYQVSSRVSLTACLVNDIKWCGAILFTPFSRASDIFTFEHKLQDFPLKMAVRIQ